MQNRVHILAVGYSHEDAEDARSMRANCTCTLIRTRNGRNVIVDTMTAWDGPLLKEALQRYGLAPEDIHIVICTHGHSDHIGCNYLFTNAQWHLVGACISHRDRYLDWHSTDDNIEQPFQADEDEVIVVRTPGHTLSCVSVLVRETDLGGLVGICGDLFEREEDIWDPQIWRNAGSEDPEAQTQNRLKMAERCAYIIPGHGDGFPVTPEMREQLRKELPINKADTGKA